jgi:pimeloyl-ACP methyl ester carboxylesterase
MANPIDKRSRSTRFPIVVGRALLNPTILIVITGNGLLITFGRPATSPGDLPASQLSRGIPMTLIDQHAPVRTWTEPDGIAVRGTLVVIPGRGEQPGHYERFGARIAADGYRVHAVTDPAADPALTVSLVNAQLAGPAPVVLTGSDTGALFAAGLAGAGQIAGVHALILAGLPAEAAGPGPASWEEELEARTACPAHRGRLSGPGLRRGALYDPVPPGWSQRADLSAVTQPILALHGTDDPVSPLAAARARYAAAPAAELVAITGGRHDVLNDVTHRSVAATIVLFLERLRLGPERPAIAVRETRAGSLS